MLRLATKAVTPARHLTRTPRLLSRTFSSHIETQAKGIRRRGSRYEDESLRGVSHIIDRLAFKSTSKRTGDQMVEALENLGGNIQCASARESVMYQSASFNSTVPTTLALLAETIRDPLITEEEVQQQLEVADYEITELWAKPEMILPELVNIAAYKNNTLGNPLLCPRERLGEINRGVLQKYRNTFYRPERMVVAFAGVAHQDAVRLTEQYFGDMKREKPVLFGHGSETTLSEEELPSLPSLSPSSTTSTFSTNPSRTSSPPPPSSSSTSKPGGVLSHIPFLKHLSTSSSHSASVKPLDVSLLHPSTLNLHRPSHYTGGYLSLPPIPPPANPTHPSLSHIHIAFEALPISSPDIYALATLQTLLGGGGSFSAGGPGKGMYSRLYTNVLNQHGWVESCVAFNLSYTDSGIFGISASCVPSRITAMVEVICRELHALTTDSRFSALEPAEVNRAKNQLRSALLMNLESRMVELEDLGRQVQVHGRKVGVREMCARIDALTADDLRRVAKDVFGGHVYNKGNGTGKPTVVVQEGLMEGTRLHPIKWEQIQEQISMWKLGRR
ncbi:hypothetical protein ACJ72_06383 [Emergomyces africanus]|uniref:Alpha-MPP n=1 Tax=Emergomyces africanus TaxID=1955775 RepID=A0A1B7NR94_9EURO|nr:hypothetical protein ACJ72_06383 [Emergomyces africanus]